MDGDVAADDDEDAAGTDETEEDEGTEDDDGGHTPGRPSPPSSWHSASPAAAPLELLSLDGDADEVGEDDDGEADDD